MDATPDFPRQSRVPVFNMPGIVTASIAVLLAIHAIRAVIPDLWDLRVLLDLAFIPARSTASFDPSRANEIVQAAVTSGAADDLAAAQRAFATAIVTDPEWRPWTFATYGLLHGSWMHVIFNSVWLAAFGTPIVRRYGPWKYGLLSLLGMVAGATLHLLIAPLNVMPLVGASAGISALMGAASRFVFQPPPAYQPAMGWQIPPRQPLQSLPELLRNRTASLFLLVWLVTNLLFGLLAVPLGAGEGSIAWDAHLGGFFAGFLLLPLLEPRQRS